MKVNLEEEIDAIERAATACGAIVISTMPASDVVDGLVADLESAEFLTLMAHVRPRVVYLEKTKFEAREMASYRLIANDPDAAEEEEEEEENQEGGIENAGDVRFEAVVTRWCSRDGEIVNFEAAFMLDGILHRAIGSETWLEDFNSDVEEFAALLGQEAEDSESERNAAEVAQFTKMAKHLIADPLFNGPKVSRAKREYLARRLFPDLEGGMISTLVEEAENMQWLEAGYSKELKS